MLRVCVCVCSRRRAIGTAAKLTLEPRFFDVENKAFVLLSGGGVRGRRGEGGAGTFPSPFFRLSVCIGEKRSERVWLHVLLLLQKRRSFFPLLIEPRRTYSA